MAIDIIYQKRYFGRFEKNSQRSIFVDEKYLEHIEAKVEFKLGDVLKEIREFISKFVELSKELQLGEEIKNARDFFNAKYLQQPEYNFHEKAMQIRKLLNILMSSFLSDVLAIIEKIEANRPKSEAETSLEIAKIRWLEEIAKRLTGGDFMLLEPRLKPQSEFLTEEDYEKYKSDAQAGYKKQQHDFEQKLKAKAEEFSHTIADSEEAIKELRKISESLTGKGGYASQNTYKLSKRLGFMALKNADTDKKTIILKESALEEEIIHLLNEFDESKRLIAQKYHGAGGSAGKVPDADSYQFRVKLLERISWLRRAALNLLDLYVGEIKSGLNTEAVLELEEIQILYKVKVYLHILTEFQPLFREIFQVDEYIEKLRGLAINVNLYSKENLQWGANSEAELKWLSEELQKLDYLFSAQEDLNNRINPENQPEVPRDKLIDIIPREVRIQGAAGTIISGDLYLKEVNYKPRVGIIAIHGIYDSRRVYYSLAVRAANMGFLVYCPDLPSHGHPSEGALRFGSTSESMLLAIRHLKENYGLDKIGVIGWSLGSMVSLFMLMHYTAAIEEHLERFDKNVIELMDKGAEYGAHRREIRSLVTSEYEKYKDCTIDALLLLSPVDFTQAAANLLGIQKLMGRKFPVFVDILVFLGYRNFLKKEVENTTVESNPPGTRFYFNKNPRIKGVKDSGKSDSYYRKLMNSLKLGKIEEPIQARALKIWKPEELKYILSAPSQITYFSLLREIYPEVVAEIRKVPKMAIFGSDDRLIGMRQRGLDLIKIFESFGSMMTLVLKEMGHGLDYDGDWHNLYIDPVLIKHFYSFFLLMGQQ